MDKKVENLLNAVIQNGYYDSNFDYLVLSAKLYEDLCDEFEMLKIGNPPNKLFGLELDVSLDYNSYSFYRKPDASEIVETNSISFQ